MRSKSKLSSNTSDSLHYHKMKNGVQNELTKGYEFYTENITQDMAGYRGIINN